MEDWFSKALSDPWLFISGIIIIAVWRIGKTLGNRLLGDAGLLTKFLDGIREDSQEMKKTLGEVSSTQIKSNEALKVAMTEGLAKNRGAIEKLEHQLVNAIQARPADEELFEVLFTNNPIPICFVGADYKFTRVNTACGEFLGYSAGELADMTFGDLTAEEDLPADMDNVERVSRGVLNKYRMEKVYLKKDGTKLRAVLYVFRYPTSGAFLHYISIIIPT